jgi:hypothetical protein
MSRLALGSTQPPIRCAPWVLFPGIKRQGREADRSPPTSAEVKKTWLYTSTPLPIHLRVVVISQAQEQLYLFTLYFYTL